MRTKWKRAMAFLLSFLLLVGTGSMEAFAYGSTSKIRIHVRYEQSDARRMLSRVNQLRTGGSWYYDENNTKILIGEGERSPLTWDYMLEKIAMLRAAEAAVNYTSGRNGHTRLNGKSWSTAYKDCVDEEAMANGMSLRWYGSYGENLAFGHSVESSVFEAWLEEDKMYDGQSHRRNMLASGIQSIGIAHIIYNGRDFWAMEVGGENSGYRDPGVVDGQRQVTLEAEEEFLKYDGTGNPSEPSKKPSSDQTSRPSGSTKPAKPSVSLSQVKDLTVWAARYNTLELSWSPVSGARSYEIYYSASDQVSTARRLANAKKTSYKFTKAKCGQHYYFWVIPVAGKTEKGSLSAAPMCSGRTELSGNPAFTMAKTSYNSVKLKWNKVPGAKRYIVECSMDQVNWTKVFEKGGTSFTHKGRETGETYYYRVRAVRDQYITSLEGAGLINGTTVLGHVTNLKVKPSGTNGLKLTWRKVPGVAYYEVYRLNRETGSYELLTPGRNLGKTNYVDTGLAPAVSYTYKVIGFTAGGRKQTDVLEHAGSAAQTTKAPIR